MTIAIVGAGGFTGHLIVREALREGLRPILIVRDEQRLASVLTDEEVAACTVHIATLDDTSRLVAALDDARVVISAVGPYRQVGAAVVEAALAAQCHYVDVTGEQPFIRWIVERHGDFAARQRTAITAAGYDFVPGLLGSALLAKSPAVSALHVAYALGRSRARGAVRSSPGTRRSVAGLLGEPALAWLHGALVAEELGHDRQLAFFPRPLGPRRAVSIPGGEAVLVPREWPEISHVRTYMAIPGWQAEVARAVSAAARRSSWLRHRISRRMAADTRVPDGRSRSSTPWSVVVERREAPESGRVRHGASGQQVQDHGPLRAWVTGHDPYGFAAVCALYAAQRLTAVGARDAVVGVAPTGHHEPGVWSFAALGDARQLLDVLGEKAGIRWGLVNRP